MPEMLAKLTFACSGEHVHEVCQGAATKMCENYPPKMAALITSAIMPGISDEPVELDDQLGSADGGWRCPGFLMGF